MLTSAQKKEGEEGVDTRGGKSGVVALVDRRLSNMALREGGKEGRANVSLSPKEGSKTRK